MLKIITIDTKLHWRAILHNRQFVISLGFTLLCLGLIAIFAPEFFLYAEYRNGNSLEDVPLQMFAARDVSLIIFIILYILIAGVILYVLPNPLQFLLCLQSYTIVTAMRLLAIYLVPLNPPVGMIELKDPLANLFFYGHTPITKDLFFSGHTSTMFLLFLIVEKKWVKLILLGATVVIAVLLLIQHVHYTLDVIAAPLFSYVAYWLSKKFLKRFAHGNV